MLIIPRRSHAIFRSIVALTALICSIVLPARSATAAEPSSRARQHDAYSWQLAPRTRASSMNAGSPFLVGGILPPWLQCGVNDAERKVIKSYARPLTSNSRGAVLTPGPADLRCGHDRYGYRHIVGRHRNEWRTLAARTGDVWLDLADFAINAALTDPDRTVYGSRNDSFCFSREIYVIDNRTGQRVDTIMPNIIVGVRTLDVVTAYPSREQCRQ